MTLPIDGREICRGIYNVISPDSFESESGYNSVTNVLAEHLPLKRTYNMGQVLDMLYDKGYRETVTFGAVDKAKAIEAGRRLIGMGKWTSLRTLRGTHVHFLFSDPSAAVAFALLIK